jgi:DNA uptake protein ComE-like DNA-binding protein
MLNRLKPYFHFTPNEQKGIFIIVLLIAFVLVWRMYFTSKFHSNTTTDDLIIERIYLESETSLSEDVAETPEQKKKELLIHHNLIVDPNNATIEELTQIGFTSFAAHNIAKYRTKGGKFITVADLEKIYGVSQELIDSIGHQIRIENYETEEVSPNRTLKVEINSADTIELRSLPCIGKVLSKRIIRFREVLGGFTSLNQLEEVYGIDSSCMATLINYVELDSSKVSKINLNSATEEDLNKHPYISSYQARAIIKYREIMKPFSNLNELKTNHILLESELARLEKYLVLE